MKHVFVFIEVFGCEGGIQSYIQDVLSAYEQLAAEPEASNRLSANVFLLRDPNSALPQRSECFTYYSCKSVHPVLERVRLTLALALSLIRDRPDRVFCGHINLAALVSPLCALLNIPYTLLTYGKEVWYELPASEKKAMQRADRIWTISRYSRDLAGKANQVPNEKFDLLPCVVDGSVFTPGPAPDALVQRYELQNAPVLMTVARLWAGDIYKGVDVTIRALPDIAQVFPQVKYLVIGRGDDQPRLAQLADDLGVADRVIFAGFVPDQALIDHYRLASVYVMPSQEGFGIVYLEAMACGVPVIAGDSDGSADPLQDGRLGWQVPHREAQAVATACITALTGADQRCDRTWLRAESLASFGATVLKQRLRELL